jgi:nucleotide-binding universal stress UspA family protein
VFRSIVVGTDGSETARRAVETAIELARGLGAHIDVVCAYEPVPSARPRAEARPAPPDREWIVNPREDADATLREAAEAIASAGVAVRAFAREGDAADAILDVAEERGADLIVVGNRGRTGARRFVLGSVPNRVSHHAPCAVLIVRT